MISGVKKADCDCDQNEVNEEKMERETVFRETSNYRQIFGGYA